MFEVKKIWNHICVRTHRNYAIITFYVSFLLNEQGLGVENTHRLATFDARKAEGVLAAKSDDGRIPKILQVIP